jgi:hypothetical protein
VSPAPLRALRVLAATLPALLVLSVCDGGAGGGCAPAQSQSQPQSSDPAARAWTEPLPRLWVQLRHNLQDPGDLAAAISVMERAAAAGYGGVVLADFKLNLLHREVLPAAYGEHLRRFLARAAELGLVVVPAGFPFGWSEALLQADPNLAEAALVRGARFVVSADGTALEPVSTALGFEGGGFDRVVDGVFAGWDGQDARIAIDHEVYRSAPASLRMVPGDGNGRVFQRLVVPPDRQIHVSFWMRMEEFGTSWFNAMLYDEEREIIRNHNMYRWDWNQDWTRYDFVANTGDSEVLTLYLGTWNDSNGQLWIDDVTVEEVALVNLVRRPGAPLRLYDPRTAETYQEGVDVAPIVDPQSGTVPWPGNFDQWHEPPRVRVLAGGALEAGERVAIDYYAVQPVHDGQVAACLSEPAVQLWMIESARAILAAFPDAPAFFMSHDEIRQMNTCAACAGRGLEAGVLLGLQANLSVDILRAQRADIGVFVWSDMFDPGHNAVERFYLVRGSLVGSWAGLPSHVLVVNWNQTDLAESLRFFAGRGHPQIVAGYYDSGDGAASGRREREAAEGIEGVVGFMYTTWSNDWSQLESYAEALR